MSHQNLITSLVAASFVATSFAQTKGTTKDDSHHKEITEQMRLERVEMQESTRNAMMQLKEREITVDIPITLATNIYIDNNNRNIEIKTWDLQKIKISAFTPNQQESPVYKSNLIWLEQMNITTKSFGEKFTISTAAYNNYSNSNEGFETNIIKKTITIYVPKDNKLNIESKYGDVAVKNFIRKIDADITNGNLDLEKTNTLNLRSKYSNININEVDKGEIDFINGNLFIQNINEVELDSKYSTVEINASKKMVIKSINDNYELENIAVLEGFKNYGTLRITNLQESIELNGTNADIKLKNISASVKAISIDNKYADLRLPLKKIKNFSLIYDGSYSTIYKNFETENRVNGQSGENESKITTGDAQNSSFKAILGNGKDATVKIRCQNCTVDFK
ncbi:MAG: hypothetical protein ACOVO1_02010 [Chitinophagaceae bacterium]